jgi:D-alanine-D-alanine ligase
MKKKIHIAIIYNEPVNSPEDIQKYISEEGVLQESRSGATKPAPVSIDLSEVGVLEEKEDISRALQASGYRCSIINVDSDVQRLMDFLTKDKPDVIFNLCESIGNEAIHEMHVAGIYELLGILYTGSNPLTLGTALNKVRAKELLAYNQLPTPRFQLFDSANKISVDEQLNFPLIVKPSREDASVGIESSSVVSNLSELKKRIRFVIERFDQPALVEEYIDGRELNIAIIGNKKPLVLPISEIDMSTLPKKYRRIISYNAKWMKDTEEYEHTRGVCPADLPVELETQIKEIALKAFQILGCRDYARIDVRLSADNKPFILEVNPNPDISDDAGFARSARAHGFTFEELICKIVESALERGA